MKIPCVPPLQKFLLENLLFKLEEIRKTFLLRRGVHRETGKWYRPETRSPGATGKGSISGCEPGSLRYKSEGSWQRRKVGTVFSVQVVSAKGIWFRPDMSLWWYNGFWTVRLYPRRKWPRGQRRDHFLMLSARKAPMGECRSFYPSEAGGTMIHEAIGTAWKQI